MLRLVNGSSYQYYNGKYRSSVGNILRGILTLSLLLTASFITPTLLAKTTLAQTTSNCPTLFKPAVNFPLGTNSGPRAVAVGDIDGDGKVDLAVTNFITGTPSLLLGNGVGSFTPSTLPRFGNTNNGIGAVIGDFKGDGTNIQLVLDANGLQFYPLTSYMGQPFYLGTRYNLSSYANSVAVADLNGDGKDDVVALSSGYARVLLSNGGLTAGVNNSGFATPLTYTVTTGSGALALGDINGDGKLDIVSANSDSNNPGVSVLLGDGAGGFGTPTTYTVTGSYPNSLTLADFNGDGKLDVAVGLHNDKQIAVLLNNSAGLLGTPVKYPVGTQLLNGLASGDFNKDGKPDLIAAQGDSTGGNVVLLLNNGDDTFGPATSFATDKGPASVTVADLNGDGKLDLVTPNLFGDDVSVLLNDYKIVSLTVHTAPTATTGVATSVKVSAIDNCGSVAGSYRGTVHFSSSSDGSAILPTDYTFSPTDGGTHTFNVTFNKVGLQNLSVSDTSTGSLVGTASVNVSAGTGGCANPQLVNSLLDDGSCGTLRYAVGHTSPGGVISFSLSGVAPAINLNSSLTIDKAIVVDGGNCSSGGVQIQKGAGVSSGVGLIVSGGASLNAIRVHGFDGSQIQVLAGANKFTCVKVSKT